MSSHQRNLQAGLRQRHTLTPEDACIEDGMRGGDMADMNYAPPDAVDLPA